MAKNSFRKLQATLTEADFCSRTLIRTSILAYCSIAAFAPLSSDKPKTLRLLSSAVGFFARSSACSNLAFEKINAVVTESQRQLAES
jgi:hypothetical protein